MDTWSKSNTHDVILHTDCQIFQSNCSWKKNLVVLSSTYIVLVYFNFFCHLKAVMSFLLINQKMCSTPILAPFSRPFCIVISVDFCGSLRRNCIVVIFVKKRPLFACA